MNKKIDQVNNSIDIASEINIAGEKIAQAENKTLENVYRNIQDQLASKNEVVYDRGVRAAAAFTNLLTQLVLRQTIDKISLSNKEDKIVTKFMNYEMGEGNTYQFILDLVTGVETYADTPFVPTTHTDPQIEVKNCNWEKARNTLGDWSFQFHKMQTLREHEWLIYFKTNTLSTFIARLHTQMQEAIILMKRAKVQAFIKQIPISKQITGAASNVDCYDSFLELIDHIDTMQFDGTEYCINNTSKNIKAAQKSDLLVLINKKTLNLLRTGIKARLTNPGAFDLSSVVDMDNVVEFHKAITENVNTQTVISTSNDDVIAPNTVIVIDRNALIMINKLYFNGQQQYNNNMAIQLDLHYWFMLDYLPWRKAFKFTDDKLTVIPQ